MHRRTALSPLKPSALAIVLALSSSAVIGEPSAYEAWKLLGAVRQELQSAAPLAARFTQEYQPAGFQSMDRETGRVALDLPSCARWDYDEPFPKSFLLCGVELYSWQPNETSGQLYDLGSRAQPGVDLLLLDLGELEARYRVEVEPAAEASAVRLVLTPLSPESPLSEASIDLDPTGQRLLALAYRDREGNRTAFSFEEWQPVERLLLFAPPPELTWELQR